jgi:hypothetical protein
MTGSPAVDYAQDGATCDTLHAHTQVLGKLATSLAAPEPELQHAALRLSVRGWETAALPAPDGSGALVVALDLHRHEVVVEHSDGREARVALTPDRSVGAVTRDLLAVIADLVGAVAFDPQPQEVPWSVPLDEDEEHVSYDTAWVGNYFAAATRASLVLAAVRAPYRGRSTRVNAWWGSFDLAVSLYSGQPADPPGTDFITRNAMDAQEVAIGWWPGDSRHPSAAFYSYAHPAPPGYADTRIAPHARWDSHLGEYLLEWDDVRQAADPHGLALEFARAAVAHACTVCAWDQDLTASLAGSPPAVR